MKHSLHIGKEPSLQKIAIISAVMHLLFIALVVIPVKTRERESRGYYVKLVGPLQTPREQAGREPSQKEQARSVPEKKEIPKKTVKTKTPTKTDMSLEKADKAAKEIERLRALSALSKKKKK